MVGRFLNSDHTDYVGMAGTAASYDIFVYCENNPVNYVDYFGHAPSLFTLTRMHNAVISSALSFLLAQGIFAFSEVRTCTIRGTYNGRMDIYSYMKNAVWEVKRDNDDGIRGGKAQLLKYTSSYVSSLYHSWIRIRRKPEMAHIRISGAVVVGNYLVFYRSHPDLAALIVYNYYSLEQIAEQLVSALTKSIAVLSKQLESCSQRMKARLRVALTLLDRVMQKAGKDAENARVATVDFLKSSEGSILLMIIILLIFFTTGILIPA